MQKLNSLRIERTLYGIDKDKLLGAIKFEGQYAEMTVKLSEEKSQQMLDIVADAMLENAREISTLLIGQLETRKMIEGEVI
jgi:hypothetical protein